MFSLYTLIPVFFATEILSTTTSQQHNNNSKKPKYFLSRTMLIHFALLGDNDSHIYEARINFFLTRISSFLLFSGEY